MKICYPIRNTSGQEFRSPDEVMRLVDGEAHGTWLLGTNGLWHGGIREAVEAICCGYVVHAGGCQCCRSGMADDACARFGANAAGRVPGSYT